MVTDGLVDALVTEAHAHGQRLAAWGVAWARALPTVLAVPAFGLSIVPTSLRVAMGFVLATAIAPAIAAPELPHGPAWVLALVHEVLRGVPPAIAASVSLWAAVVAGGTADAAVGSGRLRGLAPAFGHDATPFSSLLGLVAIIAFLNDGGASRLAEALAVATPGRAPLERAVFDLAAGVGLGASIGAPLLVAGLLFDMTTGLATREHRTLRPDMVAPLRATVLLIAAAALFDRMAAAIAVVSH